ncbi:MULTISPECIES: DUF1345 domain-containing protein [Kribbella]|uniref:DUF1345 domain-containing protein n=2 Tax=Kribbella TaxID=182639 RepID=A0A4R0IW09_9ACTN|nr:MULTISPECIES: DUF1345 domain-containing protein [Kribbella]TCC23816.1 DUF1345 domain-containing protein [Kribbella speibonae]TCC33433.1 DUF1345 domain-containing protein [Kribbella sindirgiensis]TCC38141.1 DUF1345 domain-containing protein [Kribbella speibonae]
MNKPTSTRHTRRWPASLAVVAVLVLQVLVPTQINALPRWLMPVLGGLLLLPLVWMNPFHLRRDEPWLRSVELVLLAVLVAVNAYYLAGMIFFLNNGDAGDGKVLVKSALLIWVTNVVAFAVWYWEIDRGGPFARAPEHERETERADLLFPQMTVDLPGWKGWLPGFTDYLYVALTNATAFSPTDTLPLTSRVKTLMGIQSAISLLTIAIIAARAVNVL